MKSKNVALTREVRFEEGEHFLANTLSSLMAEYGLNDSDLGSAIGLPAPTIKSFRLRKNSNPTFKNLDLIARYFGITVGQLLGLEPLSQEDREGFIPSRAQIKRIPVLELDEIINWADIKQSFNSLKHRTSRKWVDAAIDLSNDAFAIITVGTTSSQQFQEGGVLIFDQNIEPKDRDYVIILPEGSKKPIIRQYLQDGDDIYFKSFNPDLNDKLQILEKYKVIAVLKQFILHFSDVGL